MTDANKIGVEIISVIFLFMVFIYVVDMKLIPPTREQAAEEKLKGYGFENPLVNLLNTETKDYAMATIESDSDYYSGDVFLVLRALNEYYPYPEVDTYSVIIENNRKDCTILVDARDYSLWSNLKDSDALDRLDEQIAFHENQC